MKKNMVVFFILPLTLLLPFSYSFGFGFDQVDSYDSFDQLIDGDVDYIPGQRNATTIDPESVLEILTCTGEGIVLQDRLLDSLYLVSNPINQRSMLDQPQFQIHLGCLPPDWQFNYWLFYNQTGKANFTKDSALINSYLNFNSGLFADLDEIIANFTNSAITIPKLLDLLGVIKLQERRSGSMFDFYKAHKRWNFEWKFPLYYLERNFFVTPEEQRRIEMLLQVEDAQDEFLKHALSDQIGFGDTRINIGYLAVDKDWVGLNVGFLATIPTAFSFAQGLIGSKFEKNDMVPPLSILELAQMGLCDPGMRDLGEIERIVETFALGVLDKLSANLLQTGLGNNGHVGIGLFAEKYMPFTDRFTFKSRAALEYLFPSSEKRFFLVKKSKKEFDELDPYCPIGANPPLTDEEVIDRLDFLNEQFILSVVPRVFSASIYPGLIFRAQSACMGRFGKNWEMGLGLDIWWQSREKISNINAAPNQIIELQQDKAIRFAAFESKIFSAVNYYYPAKDRDWCFTLYGDYTTVRSGIGRSFNISFHFSFDY